MAEGFSISRLLGGKPVSQPPPVQDADEKDGDETTDEDVDAQTDDETDESGEAAGPDTSDDADGESDDDSDDDEISPAIAARLSKLEGNAQRGIERFGVLQAKHAQSESDNAKLIREVQRLSATGTPSNGSGDDTGLPADELVTGGQVAAALSKKAQKDDAAENQQRIVDLGRQIDAAVQEKSDLGSVQEHYQETGLEQHKDTQLMNKLGRYHMGRAALLEKENQELKKKLESKPTPKKKPRKGKGPQSPPVPGGRGGTGEASPSGGRSMVLDDMIRRRRDREMSPFR